MDSPRSEANPLNEPARAAALSRRNFERILLIKPSSLGDIVHALPVLHGLRRRYPHARIDWLAGTSFVPLLEGHPDLDEVIPFDRTRYGRMAWNPRAARDFAAFCIGLRRRDYDLVIDLQGLFRSGFLAATTGAHTRIGFRASREFAWTFYSHRLSRHPGDGQTHAVDRNYRVASMLGFAHIPIGFNLALKQGERQSAAELLSGFGVDPDRRFVAVMPGARWETKRWYPERFAEVIDRLQEASGLACVLMGAPDEIEDCQRVAELCSAQPANLAGLTSLREFATVLGLSTAVLCHDSAPMHLAAAMDRPVVCIIGPTNPARTGPYGTAARVLRADWPCMPCYLRRHAQCRYHHRCMTAVGPDAVVDAVNELLNEADPIRSGGTTESAGGFSRNR